MSRQNINMKDGSLLVIGYDHPFGTWFATHHDDGDPHSAPRVAIGYHPVEQELLKGERPDAIIGPYPISDEQLEDMLNTMLHELGGEMFKPIPEEQQEMCWHCKEPPWRPNPACHVHPFEVLRR